MSLLAHRLPSSLAEGRSKGRLAVVLFFIPVVAAGSSFADAFDAYRLVEAFDLPAGAGPFDVLPDGRLITLVGADVHVETAVGSRTFKSIGTLADADLPDFGAAFIRVSPDGARIAVGNNGGASFADFEVGVFDWPSLAGSWFDAEHFEAAWIDGRFIALTAGEFGSPAFVTVLDTQSADPANPTNVTVIDNIGGASGGVAFDGGGRLYTGNGFTSSGPSGTGATKAFASSAWMDALSSGSPIDFENEGTLVVDVLSASPLAFDFEGNLLVGGGDFSTDDDFDFVAVVRASAVQAALGGSGLADPTDPDQVRRLDPDTANDFNFYGFASHDVSGTLYISDGGDPRVFVYVPLADVPAVSEWGMAVLGLGVMTVATLRLRRRAADRSSASM